MTVIVLLCLWITGLGIQSLSPFPGIALAHSPQRSHWSGNAGQRIGADVPDISERKFRISGGKDAKPHSAPWQVELMTESVFWCGGSIISKRHVLTAAHCVDEYSDAENGRKSFSVLAGAHQKPLDDVDDEEYRKIYHVKRVIIHKKYKALGPDSSTGPDIAILELEKSFDFNKAVKKVTLPSEKDTEFNKKTKFQATGWGDLSAVTGQSPNVLQNVTLTWAKCKQEKSYNLCAEGRDKGTCGGDSGGPLTWFDRKTGKTKLIGVTESGISEEVINDQIQSFDCGENQSIFTKVTEFLDWIEKNTK